ncbi:MAG: MFS transporter [Proteobacteria bacterium]|nr:MFS transporter [Pseudomonadota bacterium]NCA27841.1 MFS transporter [Pseudomonadota bacterium]
MFQNLKNLLFIRETKFIYLSFFLFASAVGINLVTFPSILKQNNVNPSEIGLAFGAEILGIAIMSFYLSKFVAKFGLLKSVRIASILYSIITLVIYFYYSFLAWLILVFILGCGWLIFAITRVSWLNTFLKNDERGLGLGIFSALISAGVACGPLIVNISGANNYNSFIISALLVQCASICLNPLKKYNPPIISADRISLIKFYKKNPNSFYSRFFQDFISYIILGLSVVFGSSIGFSNETSGLLITAYMASGFFDIVVGLMLKKIPAKKLINIGYIGCLYCFLVISLYQKSLSFLMLFFFIFGLFIACIYVSVFKMMNEDYPENQLVPANSTFQLIGTLGSISGTIIGGLMINFFGPQGFPIAICFGCLFYLTFLVIYEKTR